MHITLDTSGTPLVFMYTVPFLQFLCIPFLPMYFVFYFAFKVFCFTVTQILGKFQSIWHVLCLMFFKYVLGVIANWNVHKTCITYLSMPL